MKLDEHLYNLALLYVQASKSDISYKALDTLKKLIKTELKRLKVGEHEYLKTREFSMYFYDSFYK